MINCLEGEGIRAARLVQARPGQPVAALLASGEVDLGFQQLGELIDVPGIAVAGLLPEALQAMTTFAGAAAASGSAGREVQRLLRFLASPGVAHIRRRHGMSS